MTSWPVAGGAVAVPSPGSLRRPRVLRWLAAAMLAASFLDNFTISRIPFLHNLASVFGIVLLIAFVLSRGARARYFDRPGRYVVYFIIVTAAIEVSRILAGGGSGGVFAFRVYLQYVQVAVLYLIVFDLVLDQRVVRAMGAAFLFSTFMMSLVANLRLEWLTEEGYDERVGVVGLNLNDQAFLYALGITSIVCWVLARWPRMRTREVALCGAAGSMLFALVDTASRAGAAALLVGFACVVLLFLRRGRFSAYFTVVPLLVLVVAFALLTGEVLRKRTEAAVMRGDTGLRVELAKSGTDLFLERPLVGWGAQYSHDLGSFMRKGRPIAAHNLYLQMLLSFGIVGFLPWAAAVAASLKAVWRLRWSLWGATLLSLWLMTLVFGAAGNLGYDKHFWLLLALVGRAWAVQSRPISLASPHRSSHRSRPFRVSLGHGVPLTSHMRFHPNRSSRWSLGDEDPHRPP